MWQNVDIFQECEAQNVLIFLSHSWNIDVKWYALQNTKYGRSELHEILSKIYVAGGLNSFLKYQVICINLIYPVWWQHLLTKTEHLSKTRRVVETLCILLYQIKNLTVDITYGNKKKICPTKASCSKRADIWCQESGLVPDS